MTKLKSEFRNIRAVLMNVYSTWKLSGQGDNEDDSDDHIGASKFIDLFVGICPYTICTAHLQSTIF